jgi:hypothetical protein
VPGDLLMNKQLHIDRRITRTKIAIRDALVFLIEKKAFIYLNALNLIKIG